MKRVIILVAPLLIGTLALASNDSKVNLCHKTSSDANPWVVQEVNANEEQSHLDNGDFLYAGPLKDNGHPDQKAADEWCNDNAPGANHNPPDNTPNNPPVAPVAPPAASPAPIPTPTTLPDVGGHGYN